MTNTIAENEVPEIAPTFRFQWEEAQNCYVLLYPEGMVKLNPSAAEILKHCDGKKTVSEIIGELKRQFQSDAIDNDVRNFIGEAHGNGWIRAKQSV